LYREPRCVDVRSQDAARTGGVQQVRQREPVSGMGSEKHWRSLTIRLALLTMARQPKFRVRPTVATTLDESVHGGPRCDSPQRRPVSIDKIRNPIRRSNRCPSRQEPLLNPRPDLETPATTAESRASAGWSVSSSPSFAVLLPSRLFLFLAFVLQRCDYYACSNAFAQCKPRRSFAGRENGTTFKAPMDEAIVCAMTTRRWGGRL